VVINITDDKSSFEAKRCQFYNILLILFMLTINQAIVDITNDKEFKELHKFQLSERDWDLLKDYQEILQVITCLATFYYTDTNPLGSPCIPGCFGC